MEMKRPRLCRSKDVVVKWPRRKEMFFNEKGVPCVERGWEESHVNQSNVRTKDADRSWDGMVWYGYRTLESIRCECESFFDCR